MENNAASPDQGTLARMNFAQGKITIVYHDFTSATNLKSIPHTLLINLSGNSINFHNNAFFIHTHR